MGNKPTKNSLTDDNGDPQFFKDERVIWWSENLTGSEKAVYAQLKSFYFKGKPTHPSIRTVCKYLSMGSDTVYKCRKRLKQLGIIDWTTERGRKHSCKYRFILETGTSEEKTIAWDNLLADKIAENKDSLNSRKKGIKIAENKDSKIAENKDTNKNKRRRTKKHTQKTEKSRVCVDSDSLKEKTDHMALLPEDVQGEIRLHKTLNPKEDVQDLAEKACRNEWKPTVELSDLAEYIKLSLSGDYVKNRMGLRAHIIKQHKDGTLDPKEGLKDLKGVDEGWNI